MTKVTEEFVKRKTREFTLETIFDLSLEGSGLLDVGCLGECINIIHLDLSANKISSVLALKPLVKLEYLNLSSNRLSALSGLEHLQSLSSLDVSGNFLNSIDCLLPLTKCEKLTNLRLKDDQKNTTNPMYDGSTEADDHIVNMLPWLKILNDQPLLGEGKEFKKLCDEMEAIVKRKIDLSSVEKMNKTSVTYAEDLPHYRIGSLKNEIHEETCALLNECEERSTNLRKRLQEES